MNSASYELGRDKQKATEGSLLSSETNNKSAMQEKKIKNEGCPQKSEYAFNITCSMTCKKLALRKKVALSATNFCDIAQE